MNIEKAQQIVGSEPCCGEYETCMRACTPRGEWIGKREVSAYAVSLAEAAGAWLAIHDEGMKSREAAARLYVSGAIPAAAEVLRAALAKNPAPVASGESTTADREPMAQAPVSANSAGAGPAQDCRNAGPGRGLCDMCANGHYHACRYRLGAPVEALTGASAPCPRCGIAERGRDDWYVGAMAFKRWWDALPEDEKRAQRCKHGYPPNGGCGDCPSPHGPPAREAPPAGGKA